ncbi:MAG: winged helix-turn-helix domain-containing protein [Acidobacteria bacterium]|nr:winged helix-turn-helix domain-containing protein [Acidobacteriota bacterium]
MKAVMSIPAKQIYEFGQFRLEAAERRLLRDGVVLPLTPKAFDTLLLLVENSGHVLGRKQLLETLWPDAVVEENTLTQNIAAIRKALGEGQNSQRYIETVPKTGYRFVAPVREAAQSNGAALIEPLAVEVIETQETLVSADPEDRPTVGRRRPGAFQRARPIGLFGLTALALALLAVVAAVVLKSKPAQPGGVIGSILVLPFQPAGPGDDKYPGLAIADDFIARIGHYQRPKVQPVSAAYRYLTAARDTVAAGREMGAEAVLTGGFQRTGDHLTIAPQLIRVSDGALLWSGKFENGGNNFFALQDAVLADLAGVLLPDTSPSARALPARRHTAQPEAYEAYVAARHLWNQRTGESLHRSILLFEQAVAKDPRYAPAYIGLAEACAFDGARWREVETIARKALELDQDSGEAHAAIGFVRMFWQWDWDGAQREFRRAISLAPHYATARQWYATHLALTGRMLEAQEELRRALELDPFSLSINADQAQLLYFTRRYDQAVEQCRKVLALDPDFINARICLYQTYTLMGRHDEAIAEYFKLQALAGSSQAFFRGEETALQNGYAESGIRGFWKTKIAGVLNDRSPNHHAAALYYALLGEKEAALKHLAQAYRNRDFALAYIKVEPGFSEMSGDRRFQQLLGRIFSNAKR